MSELLRRPAVELAALVRARELSARELTQASLDRISAVDPQINAFAHVAAESALAAADAIDGSAAEDLAELPFAGVPIAIKNNRAVAGLPLTMASDLFGEFTPTADAYPVARLREAGCVIVGTTSLPEFGLLPTCEPRRFGATANPWDLGRTPGGSSGGSAAAVAAGMVPIAHGNDGGGSIRIPAACCGLVGLKPARGRVSSGPDAGQSFLVADGVLARDVRDSATALDVLAGYEPGDATWAPPPAGSFADAADAAAAPDRPLRIAVAYEPALDGARVDPVSLDATRRAATLLSELGHELVEAQPPWNDLGLLPVFTAAFGPLSAVGVAAGGRLAGRDPGPDDVEPLTWAMWERARAQDTVTYLLAQATLERTARRLIAFMLDYDAVLTPALGMRPVRTGEIHGRGPDPLGNFRRSGHFTPFTAIVNVTGQPAVSVPLYHGDDGLPTAVQLIGPPAGEDVLLALTAQLQQASDWTDRTPADPPDS